MIRKQTVLLCLLQVLLIITVSAQNQLPVTKMDVSKLPKSIKYEGKVQTAVRWTDNLGDNIVITTETGIYRNPKFDHEMDGNDAELFAYHFLIKGDSVVQTWRVYDLIADCVVDIDAEFIKNTFQVTDLDHDGIGEVWLMYKTACHGDVSPCNMKVIMYTGQQKFAMRGLNKTVIAIDENGRKQYDGGSYTFDKAFAEGPKAYLDFAKKLWKNHIYDKPQ